jgi:hypothetical protein
MTTAISSSFTVEINGWFFSSRHCRRSRKAQAKDQREGEDHDHPSSLHEVLLVDKYVPCHNGSREYRGLGGMSSGIIMSVDMGIGK